MKVFSSKQKQKQNKQTNKQTKKTDTPFPGRSWGRPEPEAIAKL